MYIMCRDVLQAAEWAFFPSFAVGEWQMFGETRSLRADTVTECVCTDTERSLSFLCLWIHGCRCRL